MVFVELFDAHHTPSEHFWRNDHGPERLSHIHQSSASELYATFTSASTSFVRQRTLRWDSVSRCCFSQDGSPLPAKVCDPSLAHDELAGSFDFVVCHDTLRVASEWTNTSYPHYPTLPTHDGAGTVGSAAGVAAGRAVGDGPGRMQHSRVSQMRATEDDLNVYMALGVAGKSAGVGVGGVRGAMAEGGAKRHGEGQQRNSAGTGTDLEGLGLEEQESEGSGLVSANEVEVLGKELTDARVAAEEAALKPVTLEARLKELMAEIEDAKLAQVSAEELVVSLEAKLAVATEAERTEEEAKERAKAERRRNEKGHGGKGAATEVEVRAGGGEGLLAESVESVGESVEIGADMQLKNDRVAILVPTHPPMFKFVLEFFDSCMVYNCSKTVDIYVIFTNELEKAQFEHRARAHGTRTSYHAMVCGNRCLGNACEPNTKKFYGLRRLTSLVASGAVYPYRYAVCFDSETVFVRDPFDLPESIRLLDERKIYYSTYHNDTMDHVTYPAYALLRWHPSWRHALVHETRGFHLHGWWSDLPYYDMAKVTDFFLAFVGENLFQYDHHLTTAVIQTSRELGRWAFEHNVYKYYMIANYGWKMADLNQHPDTKHFMPGEGGEDRRSWLEVHQYYTRDHDEITQLLDTTKVLWVAGCMEYELFKDRRVYFQFQCDRGGACYDDVLHVHRGPCIDTGGGC